MSLKTKTRDALTRFADSPGVMAVEHEGVRLVCEWNAVDSIACSFDSLTLESDVLADADVDRLRGIAEGLSRRLSYLLEPIAVLEADSQEAAVLIRSQPPGADAESVAYYELMLRRGGSASLRRFRKDSSGPRLPIACQVTLEVFERLVIDLDPTNF
ncbi:MAG: hypothetical protein N2C14_04250 [Planctomycetales bacterium]